LRRLRRSETTDEQENDQQGRTDHGSHQMGPEAHTASAVLRCKLLWLPLRSFHAEATSAQAGENRPFLLASILEAVLEEERQ
jgi:hypothetical protein